MQSRDRRCEVDNAGRTTQRGRQTIEAIQQQQLHVALEHLANLLWVGVGRLTGLVGRSAGQRALPMSAKPRDQLPNRLMRRILSPDIQNSPSLDNMRRRGGAGRQDRADRVGRAVEPLIASKE